MPFLRWLLDAAPIVVIGGVSGGDLNCASEVRNRALSQTCFTDCSLLLVFPVLLPATTCCCASHRLGCIGLCPPLLLQCEPQLRQQYLHRFALCGPSARPSRQIDCQP